VNVTPGAINVTVPQRQLESMQCVAVDVISSGEAPNATVEEIQFKRPDDSAFTTALQRSMCVAVSEEWCAVAANLDEHGNVGNLRIRDGSGAMRVTEIDFPEPPPCFPPICRPPLSVIVFFRRGAEAPRPDPGPSTLDPRP
jgi:hypothetical protein